MCEGWKARFVRDGEFAWGTTTRDDADGLAGAEVYSMVGMGGEEWCRRYWSASSWDTGELSTKSHTMLSQ